MRLITLMSIFILVFCVVFNQKNMKIYRILGERKLWGEGEGEDQYLQEIHLIKLLLFSVCIIILFEFFFDWQNSLSKYQINLYPTEENNPPTNIKINLKTACQGSQTHYRMEEQSVRLFLNPSQPQQHQQQQQSVVRRKILRRLNNNSSHQSDRATISLERA